MNRIAPIAFVLRGRCLIVLIAILAFLGVGCSGPDFSVNSLDATDMGDGGREALPPLLCPHCQDPGSTTGADVGADATIDGGGSNDATAPADAGVDPSMDASMDQTRSGDSRSSQLIPCTAGGACPVSDCQNGTWACTDAGRVCQPTTIVTPGTPCGTAGAASQVCSSTGACLACNAGGDCADALMPCVKKSYDCTSGAAVCRATGNVADGVSCGTGLYCNAGGCAACKVGAACPPAANPCHVGKITACTGGVATCTDQMTSAAAGTACTAAGGGSGVCDGSGGCAACSAGAQCSPNGTTCSVGVQSCSAGPQCTNAVYVREGQSCGTSQICHNGTCVACDSTTCSAGCCDSHGCVTTAQSITECGTGAAGGACKSCSGPSKGTGSAVCTANACSIACSGATPDTCSGACVSLKTDDNNCGSCGHVCTTTTGAASHCDGTGQCNCVPKSSTQACGTTIHCGPAPDGCGGTVDCGSCTGASSACCGGTCTPLGNNTNCSACGVGCSTPNTCGGGGTTKQCGCTSEPDATLCAKAGLACGTATLPDRCGVSRPRACGGCPVPAFGGPGACTSVCTNNVCLCPSTTPDMASCGPGGAIQSCGGICRDLSKDSANCGGCGVVCTSPQTCDGAGVPGKCDQCPAGRVACDDGSGGCVNPSCCIATSQCNVTAPGNPCNMGCPQFAGGCKDTGVPVPDGTSCGPTSLCCGGTCTAKPAGAPLSCN